jgi:hypothetical protein
MPRRYDAGRTALYSPADGATFFAAGRPASEALLCAELARLAYARFEVGVRDTSLRALLQRIGFPDTRFFSAASTDTQAFITRDPVARLTILAFRGTESRKWRDLRSDLKAWLEPWRGGGQVHHGFAEALTDIWKEIEPGLGPTSDRLLLTGHSLGAALATLAASLRRPDALYTFGCPRVGDQTFVDSLPRVESHRFVDCTDVVCRLPFSLWGYRHLGRPRYFDRLGLERTRVTGSQLLVDGVLARSLYMYRWAWRPGTVWVRDLADHAPINYVSAVEYSKV